MESHSSFDVPLESLYSGVHTFRYTLDDAFFEAFPVDLLQGGDFDVVLDVERVRNQFTFGLDAKGAAKVTCDRCLEPFGLPMEVEDEVLVKFDTSTPREEEAVVYVPYGTERFNVARLIYEAIGLHLPMSLRHEFANLQCDPTITKYLASSSEPTGDATDDNSQDLSENSPWSVLRGLGSQEN